MVTLSLLSGCERARPCANLSPGDGGFGEPKTFSGTPIDKLDLLFVVDDTPGMVDLHGALARRIPELVRAILAPRVVTTTGRSIPSPILDLHVGVITSSLGSHGTSACDPGDPHSNDHGHLLPRAGEGAAECARVEASPLTWAFDPHRASAGFTGEAGVAPLQGASACVVQSIGHDGCSKPETWEALYHFLIDPQPYLTADVKCTRGPVGDTCGTNKIEVVGVDEEILRERSLFLRRDSYVAIVVVSNQNDASLKPAQLNWLPWGYAAGQMQRGWKGCGAIPDDFEPETADEYASLHAKDCYSCFENTAGPGHACDEPWASAPFILNGDVDATPLRAFHQVQRFGYNFLWSRQRYVDGLTRSIVPGVDSSGRAVGLANPLFQGGYRTPDLITVATIVGVPPALVRNEDGSAKALSDDDWARILSADVTKRDPHMIESIAPRTARGLRLFHGDRGIDATNGGEREIAGGDDLQLACIGPRASIDPSPDCVGAERLDPRCTTSGSAAFYGAYPGLRHLRIAHALEANVFVGSICDDDLRAPFAALAERLRSDLEPSCTRWELTPNSQGRVDCVVFKTFSDASRCESLGAGYCTPGAAPCRPSTIAPREVAPLLNLPRVVTDPTTGVLTREKTQAFEENGNVFVQGTDGVKALVCEERQLTFADGVDRAMVDACLHDPAFDLPKGSNGWCYSTDPAVVGDACVRRGSAGTLRFAGDPHGIFDGETFLVCGGAIGAASSSPTCD